MWFVDPPPNEVPPYVGIASNDGVVLAHGHYDSHADAIGWCARAMKRAEGATQIAVARTAVLDWDGFGKVPALVPTDGWILDGEGWSRAEPHQLVRSFDHLASSTPRSLSTEPPPDDAIASGCLRRPTGPEPIVRSAFPNPVAHELHRLNELLERLLAQHAPSCDFELQSPSREG